MPTSVSLDEGVVSHLPLTLAQLLRRAQNALTPLHRHNAALNLAGATFQLLASVALAEYVRRPAHEQTVKLPDLGRPSLGHWWGLARDLIRSLAENDSDFRVLRDGLLGDRPRHDLPRAAALDAALRAALGRSAQAQTAVRPLDVCERILSYRNHVVHAWSSQPPEAILERVPSALVLGMAELLGRIDLLAGRRLLYAAEVSQSGTGKWRVQRYDLCGDVRLLDPLDVPLAEAARLPRATQVYLESPAGPGGQSAPPCSLHPLVVFDPESLALYLFKGPGQKGRIQYLDYQRGQTERDGSATDLPPVLAECLGLKGGSSPSFPESVLPGAAPTELAAVKRLGEFELRSLIGSGGMGLVYRAWQPSLDREVALKCLYARSPDADDRFTREIQALGRVEHPHLVKIFTCGAEADQRYYTMELIEGTTLETVWHRLRRTPGEPGTEEWRATVTACAREHRAAERSTESPLPLATTPPGIAPAGSSEDGKAVPSVEPGYIAWVVEMIRQASEAAQALHEKGIVHRDIKPGNIMVTADGVNAVLMDLGLAQVSGNATITQDARQVGTPRYMSPEQVLNLEKQRDARSDIYSLGVTLWEMLTLRPMYGAAAGVAPLEVMRRIAEYEEPDGIRAHQRRVPPDLERIVGKCLAKNPADRYASAAELAQDLARWQRGEPVSAHPRKLGYVLGKYAQRHRRAIAATVAIALSLLLVGGLGSLWYWNRYRRVHTAYYASWIYHFGEPIGVGLLTEEQVRHRWTSCKFYRRGGHVEAMEIVDHRGQPTIHHTFTTFLGSIGPAGPQQRDCRYEIKRNDQGQVTDHVARDRAGEVVWTFHFDRPENGHFSDKNGYIRTASGSGAAYVQFTWSPEGLLQGYRFCDLHLKPEPGVLDSFGQQLEDDAHGWPMRVTFLGPDGQPCAARDGYTTWALMRNDLGDITELAYLDANGHPILGRNAFATQRLRYDEFGNVAELSYFGVDGRPTLNGQGYARMTVDHDEAGNPIRVRYFGADGKPTRCLDGNAGYSAAYDDDGNRLEVTYLDMDGRPTWIREGYARIRSRYDRWANPTETAYFGPDGQPALCTNGYARLAGEYDEKGTLKELAFFDQAGKPTWCRDGYARETQKHDAAGHITEKAFFGVDGKPALLKEGYASARFAYDDRGNISQVAYYDPEGRPTSSTAGFARLTREYDALGHLIGETFFGTAGQLVRSRSTGCARWTAECDERGNRIRETSLDERGQPIRNRDGYAWFTAEYDARGKVTRRAYFGPDGQPVRLKDGSSAVVMKYDARGRRIERLYLDGEGKPVMLKAGYAEVWTRFDERGYVVGQTYLNAQGKPVVTKKEGYARFEAEVDPYGHDLKVSYFDARGRLTETNEGFACATARFDEAGNRVERAYFDRHGKPTTGWHREVRKFDSWGRQIELTYLDGMGRLAANAQGSARVTTRYDERGNQIERAYFDRNNQPTRGCAKERMKYDSHGNLVEMWFLDRNDQSLVTSLGCAGWKSRYDERGNRVERTFSDATGAARAGWARERQKYDARNRLVETSYWTAAGRPALYRDGYARVTVTYDDDGNVVDGAFFNLSNKPVAVHVVVMLVFDGWQGKAVGLHAGDVIESYDGMPVVNVYRFKQVRDAEHEGDRRHPLVVVRNGQRLTVLVHAGDLGVRLANRVLAPSAAQK